MKIIFPAKIRNQWKEKHGIFIEEQIENMIDKSEYCTLGKSDFIKITQELGKRDRDLQYYGWMIKRTISYFERKEQERGAKAEKEEKIRNFNLVRAREGTGLTGEEFAELAGIPTCTYYAYEKLECGPSKERRKSIADLLGKDEESLFPIEFERERRNESDDVFDNSKRESYRERRVEGESSERVYEQKEFYERFLKLLSRLKKNERECFVVKVNTRDLDCLGDELLNNEEAAKIIGI